MTLKIRLLPTLLILTAGLAACGQTGGLYLPDEKPATAQKEPDQKETVQKEKEKDK